MLKCSDTGEGKIEEGDGEGEQSSDAEAYPQCPCPLSGRPMLVPGRSVKEVPEGHCTDR